MKNDKRANSWDFIGQGSKQMKIVKFKTQEQIYDTGIQKISESY